MKNYTSALILFLLMAFGLIHGQTAAPAQDYNKTLLQTVKELNLATNQEAYEKVLYKFERLNTLKQEKDWILLYNIAYCKIVLSRWKEGSSDLEDAVSKLQKAARLSPNNSEILTLESRAYILLIGKNTTKNGPKYTQQCKSNLDKAISLNKNNPRAYLVYGMYYIYFPKIVGGDPEKGCKIFNQAASLYNQTKPDPNSVKPQWGKELNEWYIKNNCK
ncbi:tetratricopeptide repeat protein [Chryseobacterium kwangjuense]|uniref:Tetratricopeptide repeat protein n=1 Tax=Chryseobacterium kwangjuense TaxID=267125 RepID=A0ABW9K5M3_9FLAO